MNKTYTVTINNLTEADMRDVFYEAIEKLGIKAGQQIPTDMLDLRERVIKLMFSTGDKNER
jgi:hypothetical protein